MEDVNTKLEEIFKTLSPTDGLEPEGFCINSRNLHKAMQVRTKYADWIRNRIEKFKFEVDTDYIRIKTEKLLISEKGEIKNARGGDRKSTDYLLTIDMAKNLCMIENTNAGAAVRTYFIQAEKALRTLEPELTDEIQQKILGYNQFLDSSNTYSMAEAAQLLGTGRTRLMKDLRDKSYLKANNTPYQKTIELGYMITKLVPTRVGVSRVSGRDCSQRSGVITVARVTAKGLNHLRHKL